MATTEKTPAKAAAKPKFPRAVNIVNDTAIDYVVAGTFAGKGSKAVVNVKDEDELTRINTDCEYIVALQDNYKEAEVAPLRVAEIDAA